MTERTGEHPNIDWANTPKANTGEPKLAAFVSWLVLGASFGLSASTWIAIALLAGFTDRINLFGSGWVFNLAWLMPVAIDGYVVVALLLWTAPVPEEIAAFAKKNTYAAASVGVLAQSAFHCAMIAAATHSVWRAGMAAVAGALPPLAAALSVHMRALIRRRAGKDGAKPAVRDRMPAVNVRRVIVPSGLVIADQNTGPITAPNGHQIGERIAEQIAEQIGAVNTRTDAAANTPNTPDPIAPNTPDANTEQDAEHPITERDAEQQPSEAPNVRPITSGRRTPNGANTETAKNVERIKRKFKEWRTDMPSARAIGTYLGVSPSTGYSYQQKLVAERDTPNTQATAKPSEDDSKERQAVRVS